MGVYHYTRAACRRRLAVCAASYDPIVVEDLPDMERAEDTTVTPPVSEEDPVEDFPPEMPPEEEEEYVPEIPPNEPEIVDYTPATLEYTPATPDYTPATSPGEEYLYCGMCSVAAATLGGALCDECRALAHEIERVIAAPENRGRTPMYPIILSDDEDDE